MKTTKTSRTVALLTTIALATQLTACATNPNMIRPIVDTKNTNQAQYNQDLSECQQYANQIDPGSNAATGAVAGALFGAIIGGIIGGRDGARLGAKLGGVDGAVGGAAGSVGKQSRVVENCLRGRGYQVL